MKRETLRNFALVMSLLVVCALVAPVAMADTLSGGCGSVANVTTCNVNTTGSGGPVNATAVLTFTTNTITVTLTNNLSPSAIVDVAQAISGLYFTLSGGQTSGTFTMSGAGVNVGSGGVSTSAGTITSGWALGQAPPGSLSLCVICSGFSASATPSETILPGTGTPTYSSANGSITTSGSHQPFLNGTVTFTLTVAGVTSSTTASNVFIQFGTTAALPGTTPPVPEPTSMALLGTGLLGLAGAVRRKLLK